MQSRPGLTLVAKLLLSSTAASLPCGAVQENKPPFAWSQVHGGLEDAAIACWGTGGGTSVGDGPPRAVAMVHAQGSEAKLSEHGDRASPALLCCWGLLTPV